MTWEVIKTVLLCIGAIRVGIKWPQKPSYPISWWACWHENTIIPPKSYQTQCTGTNKLGVLSPKMYIYKVDTRKNILHPNYNQLMLSENVYKLRMHIYCTYSKERYIFERWKCPPLCFSEWLLKKIRKWWTSLRNFDEFWHCFWPSYLNWPL